MEVFVLILACFASPRGSTTFHETHRVAENFWASFESFTQIILLKSFQNTYRSSMLLQSGYRAEDIFWFLRIQRKEKKSFFESGWAIFRNCPNEKNNIIIGTKNTVHGMLFFSQSFRFCVRFPILKKEKTGESDFYFEKVIACK